MLLHDYLNNLSNISNLEIQSIKKRVDFYVNHYKISTQKTASESKVLQLDFLLNLNHILENEIQERKVA